MFSHFKSKPLYVKYVFEVLQFFVIEPDISLRSVGRVSPPPPRHQFFFSLPDNGVADRWRHVRGPGECAHAAQRPPGGIIAPARRMSRRIARSQFSSRKSGSPSGNTVFAAFRRQPPIAADDNIITTKTVTKHSQP